MTGSHGDREAPTVAAFFDVDNTIVRGASAYHIARGLKQRGYFRNRDIIKFAWEQAKYQLFGESRVQMDELREEGLSIIRGWSAAEMAVVGEEVYDEVLTHRIFPGTKAIIDEHRAQGHQVWLVTASPIEIGRVIASRLGVSGALGTVAEVVDGYYTGRLVGDMLHKEAKASAVEKLAIEENLDLSRSFAYGDSMNDGPMLDSVGNPCAINPDSHLRKYATQRGWPMREFRNRRKNGRRGIVKSSMTGTVWAFMAVARGIKGCVRGLFRRGGAPDAPAPAPDGNDAKHL